MGGIGIRRGDKKSRCPVIRIRCATRLSRVGESAWLRAQEAGVQSLYERRLVRGKVYAVDGSGLGDDFRLVALVCVSATRPIIVAWRLLSGSASEKGQEAAVTRSLIEQVLEVAGPKAISLLLADALYADCPRWGERCQPVGVPHPRCDHPGVGCRATDGVGQYAQLPRWLCRFTGVSP